MCNRHIDATWRQSDARTCIDLDRKPTNVQAFIVSNLVAPTWPITLANLMLIIQVIGCYQARCSGRII